MQIRQTEYDSAKGKIVLFSLTNANGSIVELSNLGAGITKIVVPDSNGRYVDVVLGYHKPQDYLFDDACAGKTPGRFANRIARGEFSLCGTTYHLEINNAPNSLHGGREGFHNQLWNYSVLENGVLFSYHSRDGECGYPGNMDIVVTYTWNDFNELTIEYGAEADTTTIVNLTNHAYFNLLGENTGSCLDQELRLNSSLWLPTNDTDIPLGHIADVGGTPMDFRHLKKLGADINEDYYDLRKGKGYNHFFFVDGWKNDGEIRSVASLVCHDNGIRLEVKSTQCGVMLYTGNWLAGSPESKSGRPYDDYEGVAIECQGAPDAPNHSNFPSTVLEKGSRYCQIIKYMFSTDN